MRKAMNHAAIKAQVDAIMAKNRAKFGGWSMSITPPEPVVPGAPTEPPAAAATPPVPTPPATAPVDPATPPAANVWEDPEAAKAEIDRLRKENGAARTNAKAQAAEEAKKELTQSIAKALGLAGDDETDPAKLTASLTASQAEAKRARVELAVFRNAATAGGDPAALLDSSSFLASLEAVDPTDNAAVAAAVAAAITANPRLGAAPGDPRTPAPNPAQGAAAGGVPISDIDRQIEDATKAGNFQLVIALKQRRSAENAAKKS